MDKYGRNYLLTIQATDGSMITIAPPFTLEFDITRSVLSSANVASIRIYNLNATHRNQIRKDPTDFGTPRSIILQAGYGTNISQIFSGNITQAWSTRDKVDFITNIESFDGGFAFSNQNSPIPPFPKGTTNTTILTTLIKGLPGVSVGAIGNYAGSISRGNSYDGSSMEVINKITGAGFFIDNGKANCLGINECIAGDAVLINAASGLIGTPVRQTQYVNLDMLFEPKVRVGQQAQIDSSTFDSGDTAFNTHFYKVLSIKHRGIISQTVAGEVITSLGFFCGTTSFTQVQPQ